MPRGSISTGILPSDSISALTFQFSATRRDLANTAALSSIAAKRRAMVPIAQG